MTQLLRLNERILLLRGDVVAGGYGPDTLSRLDERVAPESATQPAAVNTQRERTTTALGLFG